MEASNMNTGDLGIALDFDVWCDLSARLLQRDDNARLDILIEAEIDPLDWARSDAYWSVELVRDVGAERMDRPRRYGTRCARELLTRKAHPEIAAPEPVPLPAPTTDIMKVADGEPTGAAFAVAPARSDSPTAARPSALLVPLVQPPPSVARPPSHLAATAESFQIPSHLRTPAAALPFNKGALSSEFVASASAPRQAPPESPALGETMPLGANLLAQIQSSLPFAKKVGAEPKGQESRRLTIQAYASLCVELRVMPEKTATTLAKYQIVDTAMQRAVDDEWKARFTAYPDVHHAWQKLCIEYSEWLRQTIK